MRVIACALALVVAFPLFLSGLGYIAYSISPNPDTARWFLASFGCGFLVFGTLSLMPLAWLIEPRLRRAVEPLYTLPIVVGSAAFTMPVLVYRANKESAPTGWLYLPGAIGLLIATTILLAQRPGRAFGALAAVSAGVLLAALLRG